LTAVVFSGVQYEPQNFPFVRGAKLLGFLDEFADYFHCEVIEIKQHSGGLFWYDILFVGKVGEDITI
jgi:hypothetical protein